MAFSGNVIFHVLLAVVVAVVIYFAQQHVLYGRHIVYACSSDKGERGSTNIEEDILSDNGRNISMNRKLLWPSLGFVIIILAGLFNRSMCIELIPHDYLRQYMTIIPAVVVTTVVTNIFLGNWEHSLKPSIENCPNIIVDVNGGKELFPLMDMVDSVDSDISIKKVTKDIFILYLNTRYEIPTQHTTALAKAVYELELLKLDITRTKYLFASKASNEKSADSTAKTEGFPTLQKSPKITTGKDNYREIDNDGPENQNQRMLQGKCTSEKYNPFYIYSRRQMCISLNVSKGVNIDLDTAESSELSFKQSNKSKVYQENLDRLEKEIVIVLDTLKQSITNLHIETITRDMKNKTSSNVTRQAQEKIKANVVHAKRRKSVQNTRKSTQEKVNDCVLKKKLKGVTAASEMSSEDHLISKSNENSLQSSNSKLNSVSPISSSNQPNDGSPDISQSQTDDGSVQSSLSQSFGSSKKSNHSAINDRPLESSSTGTKKESSEYSHIAVESSSMDSSNGVSNAGSLESSSSKANTGSIKTSQNPNPVAKGSHISLYQDDDYESIGSILDKLNTTFLYICSKLMPNEALKQNVRIHWNKIILVFLTVIFCAEAYAWFRFIVYLWKAMANLLQRIYYRIRHSVSRHKVKPKTNGNMNIVVPTNIFKGKISVPRVTTVVITFGNCVASKHLEIAESVIGKENERKYPIKRLTIKKEKDLDNLPRSKVALIFVDFNESNTILEDPDQKKNIKFLTVKNILDTKEMKAIIIYCYDEASEKLDFGQLYAPKLISITTHPLLKELEKGGCVLSINKELSESQKIHLKQKLEKIFPT